jgi:signal transduction histidine kinase
LIHYLLGLNQQYYHIFYRELYYLPLVLAGLWFGLRGTLATSMGVTIFFLPHILLTWQGFSPDDFSKLMELVLLNIVGLILGLLKDREKATHQKMLKAERLAAIGRALAGVAHDIKTPLIAIGGYTQLVQKKLKKDDPAHQKLDIVVSETRRLEYMIREMLDFSRPLDLKNTRGDLNRAIEGSLSIVEGQAIKRNVEIRMQLAPNLPDFPFDDSRMRQCVINILTNAIQASPEQEAVTVCTSEKDGIVNIDVTDRGEGISSEKAEEIFLPFFTTKKEGTGLGLSIVRTIVEAHGGKILFLNGAMEGVTFRVSLPC